MGILMRQILADERPSEEQADALARRWSARTAGTAEADNAGTKERARTLAETFGRIRVES